MNITKETSSYNQRRMGRPWIAKIDFNNNSKGDFAWGNWTGDHYNGGKGVLSINANHNDIIAIGQKDHRQPRNSSPDFYVVTATGKLDNLGDKGAAYKHYLKTKDQGIDKEALEIEKTQLLTRLMEIDKILNEIETI